MMIDIHLNNDDAKIEKLDAYFLRKILERNGYKVVMMPRENEYEYTTIIAWQKDESLEDSEDFFKNY